MMIGDIALFITAIGVLGAVFGLRQSYLERLQQFEAKYVDRYWVILDRLSLDALKGEFRRSICEADEKNIRCYILLCEDEIEMRGNGYVSDRTYKLWAEGIRTQFQREPIFSTVWDRVQDEAANNHNFPYENLRQLLSSEDAELYDPLEWSYLRRRIRGLAGLPWGDPSGVAAVPDGKRPELERVTAKS